MKTIGQTIRDLRKAKGLTQEDFPGLKQCHVSQIEAGKVASVTLATLQKIARGLGISTSALVDAVERGGKTK